MRLALIAHPSFPNESGSRIYVDAERSPSDTLKLHYFLEEKIENLIVAPVRASRRTDALWQHTCFEAFLRIVPGTAYYEFNLSPSTEWAAYRFTGYRTGMAAANILPPRIDVQASEGRLELSAQLDLTGLAGIVPDGEWQIALSAVIEASGGNKSYWALKHPAGKPDFHHADGFACRLAPSQAEA